MGQVLLVAWAVRCLAHPDGERAHQAAFLWRPIRTSGIVRVHNGPRTLHLGLGWFCRRLE